MAAMMLPASDDIEPACAICRAPPDPECPHEAERVRIALDQAMLRWSGIQQIRTWVLDRARLDIIASFKQMKEIRYKQHLLQLQSIPAYSLYQFHQGHPPMRPDQLHYLHVQIEHIKAQYRIGVDEDWSRSCQRYPEVLDFYFSMVDYNFPPPPGHAVREPRAARGSEAGRRIRDRGGTESPEREHAKERRRREKRRHRSPETQGGEYPPGSTPPPFAPMPGHY